MTSAVVEMTRVCTQCPENGPQPWSAFYAGKKWPDGTMRFPMSWCKACLKKSNAAKCKAYHARIKHDPERLAIRRDQWRDYARKKLGITPDRYRVGVGGVKGRVDSSLIHGFVIASGLPSTTVSLSAGYDSSTVYKALQRDTMSAAMAVRVLHALDILPAEVGL